ncbi:MAG: GDSL-type esterase/lipase family protein [Candidatus Omnitrophota bacterium]
MGKNKFLLLGSVFIFCAFMLAGCVKKEVKNIDSKGVNIICFGDSLTFGYGVSPGEDYPSLLAKLTDVPVINSGVSADTTFDGLKRINPDVLDKDPYLVIIEFCGNDFLGKIPKQDTANNIREMVRQFQARGAMVAIVDISAGLFLKEYRPLFRNIARENGAIFIPAILSGLITNPSMKSDFLHPNTEGYKIVAQRIYEAIMPYLEQNTALRKKHGAGEGT